MDWVELFEDSLLRNGAEISDSDPEGIRWIRSADVEGAGSILLDLPDWLLQELIKKRVGLEEWDIYGVADPESEIAGALEDLALDIAEKVSFPFGNRVERISVNLGGDRDALEVEEGNYPMMPHIPRGELYWS